MRKLLLGLGIGIFLVGALQYVGQNYSVPYLSKVFETSTSAQNTEIEKLEAQLKEQKKENQSLAQTIEDMKIEQEAKKSSTNKKETDEIVKEAEKKPDEEQIIEATLIIYEGMSLYDIGQQAQDLGLIKVGRELELYLSNPTYAKLIQKGSFPLKSSQSIKEIAEIITGKTS